MKKFISILLSLIFICAATVTVFGEEEPAFTISGAIGNNCVLQRDTEVSIWGHSDKKGEKITVSFKGNTVEGTVDNDGNWLVKLPKMAADKQENTLTATMGDYTVSRTGILVGDVYLVGGQSNAEKTLSACGGIYSSSMLNDMINSADGNIRYFQQGRSDALAELNYMLIPQTEPLPGKKWEVETKASANAFSAIGFFFAHRIYEATGVPIGMINVSSAGSPVSQLMSREASQKVNYTRYENNIPVSGMFNALMNPFINTDIKGMIFYQGESENGLALTDYGKYNEYVNAYVEDLREKMDQDFPFYYVQLSSHVLDQWSGTAEQRAVQFDGLSVIKNSGMVVSMDQGFRSTDSDFAHPNYKKPVGDRLADLALARDYGIGDESYVTSPMPIYAYRTDKGITIKFKNVGDGLKRIGQHETLSGFRLITNENNYIKVEASINGTDEVLLTTRLSNITSVGYGLELLAFADYPEGWGDLTYVANLGNSNELPAPTFKIKVYDTEAEALAILFPAPTADATATEPAGTDTPSAQKLNTPIIGVSAGAVIVIAAVIITVLIIKKKKINSRRL